MNSQEKSNYRATLVQEYQESEGHYKFDDYLLDKLIAEGAKVKAYQETLRATQDLLKEMGIRLQIPMVKIHE